MHKEPNLSPTGVVGEGACFVMTLFCVSTSRFSPHGILFPRCGSSKTGKGTQNKNTHTRVCVYCNQALPMDCFQSFLVASALVVRSWCLPLHLDLDSVRKKGIGGVWSRDRTHSTHTQNRNRTIKLNFIRDLFK